MTYLKLLEILSSHSEMAFAQFQRRLIFTKYKILGVRTPTLRKIAKKYMLYFEDIFSFPDDYYEVVFIKLTMVSLLPYEKFLAKLEDCIALIDNWALNDSFKGKCINSHKEEFLAVLETLFAKGGEYEQRYVLVALLSEYIRKENVDILKNFIMRANVSFYYVHMAAAWLLAEILIKEYEEGIALLKKGIVDEKTYNKAIQKALESRRLTLEQKEFLRSLKIKKI